MVVGCIVDFFLKIWDTTDDLYHHIIRRYRSQSIREQKITQTFGLSLWIIIKICQIIMSDNCHGMGDSSELNFYLLSYLITIERVTVKKIFCVLCCVGNPHFCDFFYRWFFLGFRKEKYCWFLIFWCFLFLVFIYTDSKLIQNKNVEKTQEEERHIYIFFHYVYDRQFFYLLMLICFLYK